MPTTRISHLESLFAALDQGYCLCEMIRDESGRPVDYRFLETNPALQSVDAIRNKRFIVIPYVQATPGIDNVLAIETLAKGFHPQ